MKIIDNSTAILGDELRLNIGRSSKLRIAASCFSIYAYEALKAELNKVDSVQFIFTTPTFVPSEVTDKIRKERREFFIPKTAQESSVYGTEFEIQLRNKLVRRQSFWNQRRPKLRESLAHLVGLIMRRAGGDASVAFRASFV